jgi:hypothetical protein
MGTRSVGSGLNGESSTFGLSIITQSVVSVAELPTTDDLAFRFASSLNKGSGAHSAGNHKLPCGTQRFTFFCALASALNLTFGDGVFSQLHSAVTTRDSCRSKFSIKIFRFVQKPIYTPPVACTIRVASREKN